MDREIREFWPHDLRLSPLNCRPEDEDIAELKASIAHRGLLQPMIGRLQADDTAEIIAGGRRMKCVQQLFDEGALLHKVRVILLEDGDDADAYEASIAENVTRKPLHPVIEFESFASLAERGRTAAEIAAHFGITERQAQQRLALGQLHPNIRRAWFDGRITAEAARAFTLADPAEQASYLAGAGQNDLRPLAIRDHFAKEAVAAHTPLARFVGADAYQEAGGALVPDLFAEHRDFADGGLLRRLAEGILDHEAERVKETEGWAEVLHGEAAKDRFIWQRLLKPPAPDVPAGRIAEIENRLRVIDEHLIALDEAIIDAGDQLDGDDDRRDSYDLSRTNLTDEMERLETELDDLDADRSAWLSLSEEDRAKAVAVLEIGEEGKLRILRGFIKGAAPKPAVVKPERTALTRPAASPPEAEPLPEAPAPAETAPEAEPVKLPIAVLDGLALAATRAAAHALAAEPRIAFAALIASQVSRGGPVRLTNDGLREGPSLGWPEVEDGGAYFCEAFRTCLSVPPERLTSLAARVIARSLDFTTKAVARGIDPAAVQDLRCALPAQEHRKALVAAFDAAAYFAAAPKEFALAALAECGAANLAAVKLSKAEAAEHAARLAGEQGWLPPLLRGEAFEATAPLPRFSAGEEAIIQRHMTVAEAALAAWGLDAGRVSQDMVEDSEAVAAAGIDAEPYPPIGHRANPETYAGMKVPALRQVLKDRGVTAPFGATRDALVKLLTETPLPSPDPADLVEEAADVA
ncbi:MAG: ParB N-terminal domain-containing protein [Bosea sp.]|uniref:ParB/RepB/Spo0J family partition protein n=1 Tax=Bosea sp. (in: a-proteobacteria) TaxID=1871050 RepID=UPI0023997AE2|nr:ParB N-terminal domain-containing protein [Bosea sp. (in: a-proteobacteria)]MCP4738488.1 ParB N-terminal domain-containing protein [Bosea sp. (in: a-proteobacteria)]